MSDLSLPADYGPVPMQVIDDMTLIKLAREIAMDVREIDEILELHGIDASTFERLLRHTRFVEVLSAERAAWQSAINTHERVKLKAGAMIEEFLPTLYARLHDREESLMNVVKGAELAAKLAEMGASSAKLNGDSVDRVSITINLGAEKKVTYERDITPKVINNDPTESDDAPAN
jgi:hypothetical protein